MLGQVSLAVRFCFIYYPSALTELYALSSIKELHERSQLAIKRHQPVRLLADEALHNFLLHR